MDRGRAQSRGDDRDHVPVQPARRLRTAGVLLAVPPVPGDDWTVAVLHRVLMETLDLAKLRAVDSDALSDCGQFLPALCFAFNAKDDAVSTDFAPLTR